jgi:GAF domain-containing protein
MPAEAAEKIGRPPRPVGMLAADVVPENARSIRVDDVRRDPRFQGFPAQDQSMVEMLAARAAVALETAKLYAGEAQQRAWRRSVIEQLPEGVVILGETTTFHVLLPRAPANAEDDAHEAHLPA